MKKEIYCDESRQDLLHNKQSIDDTNRYTIIGGIWLDSLIREDLKNKIKELRERHNTFGEMKWQKVSDSRLRFYEDIIKLFFMYGAELKFRCIVIDSQKVDFTKYHDEDAELGFYKFYYQLLYHWLDNNEYYIYTDFKRNRKNNRIIELKNVLNNSCYNNCVKHIQAIDSKESLILQLEDIIMGAVGYKYNFGNNAKSESKKQIVKVIEDMNGSPIENTHKNKTKFNIFEIDLDYHKGI